MDSKHIAGWQSAAPVAWSEHAHSADGSPATLQDPVAVGFGGRKFDITGLDSNAYYCLLTSASQQASSVWRECMSLFTSWPVCQDAAWCKI